MKRSQDGVDLLFELVRPGNFHFSKFMMLKILMGSYYIQNLVWHKVLNIRANEAITMG